MIKKAHPVVEAEIVDQVDDLNEEVKVLALNLAIYLARAKAASDKLSRLEPDFIRLVNSTVKVVQELAQIINAARNMEPIPENVSVNGARKDPLETRLKLILDQCATIMHALSVENPEKQGPAA